MPQIRLVFLWHQHQPFYKDLVSGEYRLPWVRMHALKDYYGMVKLLDEFPRVHQNFNLVPSLIVQIEEYLNGTARDPFLTAASKPARELSLGDKRFVLEYLFQANGVHMIGRYPRYAELWEKFRSFGSNTTRALNYFQPQDFTDLQVLSQIAWFDEFFLQQPDVAELVRKGRGFSDSDQQFVIAKQREIIATVLPAHADAAKRGSIEISTSPFYHPIMPLVCDTNMGAVSTPGLPLPQHRFRQPEDAREQLKRGLDLHERVFGVRPRGVWPSEGSVSEEVLQIASELGINWLATDEGVLGRSLGINFDRDHNGKLTGDGPDRLYQIYRYEKSSAPINLVFRDHSLSDLIGFVYAGMPARDAASDFVRRIKQSAEPVLRKGRDAVVSVILDGENAWEFYPESGREFLRRLYAAIQDDSIFDPVTVSEAIERQAAPTPRPLATPKTATKKEPAPLGSTNGFGLLPMLTPGSWISANFNVWIGAPEDNRAWDYLHAAREFFNVNAKRVTAAQSALAYEELLIAEGSDWNWWYGPEHHSANDRDFDELYRKHLSNVYQALGSPPPDYLAQPITSVTVRPSFVPQTAYIHPRLAEGFARYFDWIGSAIYTADRRAGAMHGKLFLLDSVYAGIDDANVYGRLEFTEGIPSGALSLVVNCESQNLGDARDSASLRLEIELLDGNPLGWKLRDMQQPLLAAGPEHEAAAVVAHSEQQHRGGVEIRVRPKSFEFKLPFALMETETGSVLRLRFSVWREGLPVDGLPVEGWIELKVAPEEELEASMYHQDPSS